MEKLWFNGFHLGKGRSEEGSVDRKKIAIHMTFKSDYSGEGFYWYPTYEQVRQLIHYLTALHGEKEVTDHVLNDNSLIEIYKGHIERFLKGVLDNEIPNCKE